MQTSQSVKLDPNIYDLKFARVNFAAIDFFNESTNHVRPLVGTQTCVGIAPSVVHEFNDSINRRLVPVHLPVTTDEELSLRHDCGFDEVFSWKFSGRYRRSCTPNRELDSEGRAMTNFRIYVKLTITNNNTHEKYLNIKWTYFNFFTAQHKIIK